MGIKEVLGKTASKIMSFVGINSNDNKNTPVRKSHSPFAASIGSVLYKLLPQEEVGDKFESTQKEEKTDVQTVEKAPVITNTKEKTGNKTTTTAPVSKAAKTEQKDNKNTKSKTTKKESKKLDEKLNNTKLALRAKCIENNINYGQLTVNLSAIVGKTIKEFYMMDKNLQITLLSYVMDTIERVKKANLPDVKMVEAVVTDVALLYEFITRDKQGNVYELEKMTPDEIRSRRLDFEEKMKVRKEQKMAEIEKLPENERAAAKEAMKEEFAGYRKHIFDELSKKIPFESAMELMLVVSIKNLGDAAKELMESYPVEIREKIANTMQDYDSFKEYIKAHRSDCEELTDEEKKAIDQYHMIFGTYKTKEKLEEYEQAYVESRQNGEFSEDILKATAKGIGKAAYANIKMTSEEKETFISNWIIDNDGFLSDTELIEVEEEAKEYIEELINENPELKDNIAEVRRSIKEIVEKTLDRVLDNKKDNRTEDNKTKLTEDEIKRAVTDTNVKVQNIHREVLSYAKVYMEKQAKKFETPAIKKSNEQISTALLKGIINEKQALRNLNNSEHKFIKMCVQNPRLATMYEERIKLYIKSETDQDKLKAIAEVAPHDIVIKIVHNMKGNKEKFSQDLIKKHKVDYNTKIILEKYTEEAA